MKKFIAVISLCTLTICTIIGCGAANASSTETSESSTQTASWSILTEQNYGFPVYNSAFYNKEFGITVGYDGEIHYTNDGGNNWPEATNSSYCRWGMEIVDANVCYSCGNAGHVTKSTDGGKTYTRMTDFGDYEPNQCTMMSFIDADTGIIASGTRMALTTDGATTWNELSLPDVKIAGIRMIDSNTFSFIGNNFHLYQTKDSGNTWSDCEMNLPAGEDYLSNPQNFALYYDGTDSYTVYCFTKSDRFLKCYSTQDNWSTCSETPMPEVTDTAHLYLNKTGDVLTINANQGGSATVLIRD